MVIYTKLTTAGTQRKDSPEIKYRNSISEYNSTGHFTALFRNDAGRNANTFTIGDEVQLFADRNNPATTLLFTGTVEDIKFRSTENNDLVEIKGRDFGSRLQDVTVEPVVYNNTEVSVIVKDIIAKQVSDVTTTNVNVTTTTITHISFSHKPVFDAIKELAERSNSFFYVDANKDLHFTEKGTSSSGITLDNSNVTRADLEKSDNQIFNQVWVYGDRQLVGDRETFTSDGTGSVYTLLNRPHSTQVLVAGSTQPKKGGIFELNLSPTSGVQYLVDFDQKNIIFVSGTDNGDNIPGSSTNFEIKYDRSVPIAKFGRNESSIDIYGVREKIINDKNITDPVQAADLVRNTLDLSSEPSLYGLISVEGIASITAGQTVVLNLPDQNLTNETYTILEANYLFTTTTNNQETVLSVQVSKKNKDINDTIKQLLLSLRELQASDISSADVLTRLEFATGSIGICTKEWYVKSRTLGSSFVLGHPQHGVMGITSPQNYLGDSRSSFTVQKSGGDC